MPLDSSISRNDPWAQGDDVGFDKAAASKDLGPIRVAAGAMSPEALPSNDLFVAQNADLERNYAPAERLPEVEASRPAHDYTQVRRLLAGSRKCTEPEIAPAPPPAPRKGRISAINRMKQRESVERRTEAELDAQRAALSLARVEQAPPAPATSKMWHRMEADAQAYFVALLQNLGAGDSGAFVSICELVLGPPAVSTTAELRQLIADWLTKNRLPLTRTPSHEVSLKASEAARAWLKQLGAQ